MTKKIILINCSRPGMIMNRNKEDDEEMINNTQKKEFQKYINPLKK